MIELPRAREVRIVREAIAAMPDVRAEKIQELREQIARGEYRPDARVTALGILRESAMDQVSAEIRD